MAVIVTKAPKSCFDCPAFATKACGLWDKAKTYSDQKSRRHEDCPLKSVEGLIESVENAMILMGIPQANRVAVMDRISEYCGLEESNGET